ncbi:GerAB/ArcD/ProY family transporter [Paenibacillus sp. V4I5]|uniref:GerAB/ArcD/ProY family transporter n=1 Tax=Paenibacillus sp. V4I5 TaxID=3042306 RepID=UPI0027916902|nr:GerAB/ArcD/ProY family transporter [Paenibacillus sp. V4I5]MDQ0921016.1 hypothetical protein [Paenibacillus sp. V4I5]
MNNENILTARQLMILIILFSVGTTILVVPSMSAAETKQDAWISGVMGVGIAFLMDVCEVSEDVFRLYVIRYE